MKPEHSFGVVNLDGVKRGTQRFTFLICFKMFILKLQAKKTRKAIASKYTISYKNKNFNKSNVCKVILSYICKQRLNLDKFALVDIFINIILE